MIRIISTASGIGAEHVAGDTGRIDVRIRREPMTRADWVTHDYNVHFTIGLENTGTADVETELSVEGGRWNDMPAITPGLYVANDPDGPWRRSDFPARTDLGKRYVMRLSLAPGERKYVANTIVRPYAALAAEFDRLGQECGGDRRIIGRSLEGREIVAYIFGDPSKHGTVLVTSGFHPPEPDTLASAEIIRHLACPEGRALLDRIAVAVVPIANPDGYAHQTQGSNAAGINFYWHFARELPDRCPEAAALWRFADELAPCGYIDFHCYTFQIRKKAGPYQRPPFFHDDSRVRATCEAVYAGIATAAPGLPVVGFSSYAPHTLGAMLVQRFDTISLAKYHLHLEEGEDGCRERGLRVFRVLADTLIDRGIAERKARRRTNWRAPLRNGLILWAGLLRPTLGWLRRGRLDHIRLNRTDQVLPGNETGNME